MAVVIIHFFSSDDNCILPYHAANNRFVLIRAWIQAVHLKTELPDFMKQVMAEPEADALSPGCLQR